VSKLNDFFMMEKQYDLFSIKTRQGFPIWDILRHYVWNNINADDNNVSLPKKTKNYPRKITALFTFSKYLVIILCSLRKSSDILFIGFSRSKNEQQKLQDNYFILLQQFLPASINFFFYEVFINKSNYDNTKRVFDIIYYINKLYRKKIVEFEVLNDIKNKVDKTFGKDKISIVDLEKTLNNFYIEYKLFYFLLKIKKIKCVFLVSSFKGLCFAAKKLKIETFELQHGDIMQTTIHYNYSKELNRIESNCFIFPDILFTYSNYWIKDNNLFSRCIELGKFKFHSEKRLNICKHDIVVVSSPSHYHILKNLTIDLAVSHPKICVYFKLHPMEDIYLNDVKLLFSEYSNIRVVDGTVEIRSLYPFSNHFVAIYSTALYEAYEEQNFVYIFKRLNYLNFAEFMKFPNVNVVSNLNDFSNLYKKNCSHEEPPQNLNNIYFKKFDLNILNRHLAKIFKINCKLPLF